jgi:hypothetical protein
MVRQVVRGSVEIDAPVDVVWDVVNDPATYVEGIDWVYEAWFETEGSARQGSVYVERAKPGPREGLYRWVLTTFEPPRRAIHAHRGSEMDVDLEVLVEPLGSGRTRYTQEMRFRALPRFRPIGWIVERAVLRPKIRRDFDEMILPNYKRIAEARHSGGSARNGE